jgi:Erv1 / Alr family/Thioredoxin
MTSAESSSSSSSSAPLPDQFRYLYLTDERNKKGHVIEHIAPPSREGQVSDRPDFLFSPSYAPAHRVVIFYIDWCPVCMGLVGEYIEFAERMKDYGVETHAVSCMAQTPLCRRLKLAGYPIIRIYGPGEVGLEGHDLALSELNPLRVLEQFHIAVDDGTMQLLNETWTAAAALSASSSSSQDVLSWRERLANLSPRNWLASLSTRSPPTYRRTSQEIEADVHKSLDATLRSGAFRGIDDPLPDEAGTALRDFLMMLDKVLPPTWSTLHGLLHELVTNFVFATKSEAYLVSYLDRTPPASPSAWSPFCSHGSPTAGYSCGLWTMFHAATVGAVEFNTLSMPRNRLGTEGVALAIRNFVQEFLGCAECKAHFVSSYDACDHDRCTLLSIHGNSTSSQSDWQQLPLWLAKVHNSVNTRRAAEIQSGKRKVSRKEQPYQRMPTVWPTPEECPSCWIGDPSTTQNDDEPWVDGAVYHYLKLQYFTGYPNATQLRSGGGLGGGDGGEFRHDPNDIRLDHFLVSCALVAVAMRVWETARSYLRRVGDRLRRKLKV